MAIYTSANYNVADAHCTNLLRFIWDKPLILFETNSHVHCWFIYKFSLNANETHEGWVYSISER